MFITFEGPDNTGKTTTLNALAARLRDAGKEVVVTKQPGNLIGVRDLVLDRSRNISEKAAQMLFLADRAEHLDKVVLPALREGKTVLCDRSSLTNVAYFAAEFSEGKITYEYDFLYGVLSFIHTFEGQPNLCFMFKRPKSLILSELDQNDRIEAKGTGFQKKVSEAFKYLTKKQTKLCLFPFYPKKVVWVPEIGKHTTEEIVEKMWEELKYDSP